MKINPHYLRAFHAVASHGGFSRAAQALSVTQPTLSGQIKNLEQRVGAKLFHRRQRGIELTELGKQVFRNTREIERAEREIGDLFLREQEEVAGKLVIGADAPYQVMRILANFNARYPAVSASIRFGNTSWLLSALNEGIVDVIIAPNLSSRARLHTLPLAADRLRVFVNLDHPWRARRTIDLEELSEQTLVMREEGSTTRAVLDRALRRAGVRITRSVEIGSREAVREAVAAGLGISVIPDSERGDDPRFHFLEVANAALSNREFVACLAKNREQPALAGFLVCCQEFLRASQS